MRTQGSERSEFFDLETLRGRTRYPTASRVKENIRHRIAEVDLDWDSRSK